MRPHFKIGFLISNFEKAFVVISIAIKIMILIVLNLSILSPLHLPMVKFVNQMATLKSLVNTVFMQNIVVVYAKNIRLSVILNAVTMIQAWSIQIQNKAQSHQMNPHLTPTAQHDTLQLKNHLIIILKI